MLKEREKRILDYMKEEIRTKGYPPTVREIGAALGIKSTSTTHKDIESLVRQGYLVKDPSKPRALMVVDPYEKNGHVNVSSGNSDAVHGVFPETEIAEIPIVGRVAAGTPILAQQNIEGYFPIPTEMVPNGESFVLRVKGDSMINARINDGDIVFIKEMPMVDNGDIAAVIIDDEATLKKVYYYPDKGKLVLYPENPNYEPFIYVGEELNSIRILGKAVYFMSAL